MIRELLKITNDRHKSYAGNRRRDQKFEKGILRFGKHGKLSSRYIGPYVIVDKVLEVAYRLRLMSELADIHDVFHVSMLRKYIANPSHIFMEQPIQLKENLTYEEHPVEILDRSDQVLRKKKSDFAGEGIMEESYSRGSYLGARGSYAPSVPSLVFRMRYVLLESSLFISRTKCS